MTVNPLETAWLRLERAETHILDIEREVAGFFDGNPCETTAQVYVNEGGQTRHVVRIRPIKSLPRVLPSMISDAAANLRAPLDYAVGRVWEIDPHPDVDGDRLSFPISSTAKGFEDELRRRKIATFSPDLAEIIRAARPYAGGNDPLYALHHLARKERHVDLAAIGLVNGRLSGSISVGPGGSAWFMLPDDGWRLLDSEITVAMFDIDDFQVDVQVPANVTIRKPQVFQTQPVADALRQAADTVKGLLEIIERRFF